MLEYRGLSQIHHQNQYKSSRSKTYLGVPFLDSRATIDRAFCVQGQVVRRKKYISNLCICSDCPLPLSPCPVPTDSRNHGVEQLTHTLPGSNAPNSKSGLGGVHNLVLDVSCIILILIDSYYMDMWNLRTSLFAKPPKTPFPLSNGRNLWTAFYILHFIY